MSDWEAEAASVYREKSASQSERIADLEDQVVSMERALEGVREIHSPIQAVQYSGKRSYPRQVCTGCGTDGGNWQVWPCPTIRAIGKEER